MPDSLWENITDSWGGGGRVLQVLKVWASRYEGGRRIVRFRYVTPGPYVKAPKCTNDWYEDRFLENARPYRAEVAS